jgi:ATP-dependent DNA helicase RecQ
MARTRTRSAAEERAWQAVRRIVLERDQLTCQECGKQPDPKELDVHHLIPRNAGGPDSPANCVTLCDDCHARRHLNLQVSLARRTIERWAVALARFLDLRRELPDEIRTLSAGLHLFGVTRFLDGQVDAVLGALRDESQLIIRPTGSGKSLCFQLPAILRGQPTTFVLSPLKTLMVDQTGSLHQRKLPATFINSDISLREKQARYQMLEQGAWAMIYMAPERFGERVKPQEVARLLKHRPSFLVVDEAHVVDRWGQDFRPMYSRLGELRRELGNPPVIACTATAGVETQQRILKSLGIPDARILLSDINRPNIALARLHEPDNRRRAQIVAALLARNPGKAMIFIPTQKVGEQAQAALASVGLNVPLYYSKLDKLERDEIQNRFADLHEPPLNAIITTSAFSMGVDIPNVRLVVHWQHPACVEDYLQEFGRAGRDGKPSLALLFTVGDEDTGLLRFMAEKSVDNAREKGVRSAPEAQEALAGRFSRIDQMQALVSQNDRCFRAALLEVLQGSKPKRRWSLARWILELVFSTRTKIEYAGACCDHCQPALIDRIRARDYTPGEKLRRKHRIPWSTLWRRFKLAIAVLLTVSVVWGTFIQGHGSSASERSIGLYRAYVAKHHPRQQFTTPRARVYRSYELVCATPQRRNAATLCLLIQPDRRRGQPVRGSYQRHGFRHFRCTGAAARLHIC